MSAPSSPTTSPITSPTLSDLVDGYWDFPSPLFGKKLELDSPPTTPLSGQIEEALVEYEDLYSMENKGLLLNDPLQRQQLFSDVIFDLASSQTLLEKAMKTIEDAEAKQVWKGYSNQRAKVYLHVIEEILKKGVHENAEDLYIRALEGNVWEGCPEQQQAAIQALKSAGFKR